MDNSIRNELAKEIEEYKKLGYKFEINPDGYKVWFKENFVFGAGVLLPRTKRISWQTQRKNMVDNMGYALSEAKKHHNQ
jgi:hypothetical protein